MLADEIPDSIDVDIGGLEINHSKHLSDVELPPNVRVIARADITLVTIVPPSGYAEEMKAAAEAAALPPAAAAAAAAPEGGLPAQRRRPVRRGACGCREAAPAAPSWHKKCRSFGGHGLGSRVR